MLKVHGLTVIYPDGTKALDGFGFELGGSENVALVGGNGAGKTSLLLALAGVLEPAGGSIEFNGAALTKKTSHEARRQIGLVFQNPDDQLFMPLIYDDVAFGCRNLGMAEGEIKKTVDETLAQLNIAHLRRRSPLKLSGGEKRMAAIATVMAMSPSVLMLDEPTAFLDPKAKRSLAQALKKMPHSKIIATHDMAFAAEVCGRVLVLKGGRTVADGGPSLLGDGDFLQNCGL